MVRLRHVDRLRQFIERDPILRDPGPVGFPADDLGLHFLIVDDAALDRVHQKHPSRHQPALLPDLLNVHREYTRFRRQHHETVRRHLITAGTQAIAVQRRSDQFAIGEADRGGTVPGLLHGCVVLVEPAAIEVHLRIRHPRLGNQHHHCMRERSAAHREELDGIVQTGRVALLFVDDRVQLGQIFPEQF